jgi:hypothetical protein
MKSLKKFFLIILLVLNVLVLLGQLWPAAAPPFARTVNLIFLTSSLVYFALAVKK